jgi:hypothetical protein
MLTQVSKAEVVLVTCRQRVAQAGEVADEVAAAAELRFQETVWHIEQSVAEEDERLEREAARTDLVSASVEVRWRLASRRITARQVGEQEIRGLERLKLHHKQVWERRRQSGGWRGEEGAEAEDLWGSKIQVTIEDVVWKCEDIIGHIVESSQKWAEADRPQWEAELAAAELASASLFST